MLLWEYRALGKPGGNTEHFTINDGFKVMA